MRKKADKGNKIKFKLKTVPDDIWIIFASHMALNDNISIGKFRRKLRKLYPERAIPTKKAFMERLEKEMSEMMNNP